MPSSSSERMVAAESVRHDIDDSSEKARAKALSLRHGHLNGRAPALPVDRESTGRIVSLGERRFGVLAPRAPKERQRRPIGVTDSWEEGQQLIANWKAGRKAIVTFVSWLANMLPRQPREAKLPAYKLGLSKSGLRDRPGSKR